MPPSISSSEALVIWMLRIAMKAPIMHARTAIQSRVLARPGVAPETTFALTTAWPSKICRSSSASVGGSRGAVGRLGVYARDHRHAGPEVSRGGAVCVENDLDRNPLHDLGEIAGGVVGRQQRESLAAGRREAVDMAVIEAAGEHIDFDIDRLPAADV